MNTILLIEDDPGLGASLEKYLGENNFKVIWKRSLADAWKSLEIAKPNLVVLDWNLPDGEGLDFLKTLRARDTNLPVIFVTARVDLIDRVLGLESGANDYLSKPFEPRELIARIRVQLRGCLAHLESEVPQSKIQSGPFSIDLVSRNAKYQDRTLDLTKMEFDLLMLFCRNPGRVFTREELLNKVWGFERAPTTRTVDTHILMLRGKTHEKHFETVRGLGYRLLASAPESAVLG